MIYFATWAGLRQFLRFLFVGGAATLVDFLAFVVLTVFIPSNPTLCFVLAFTFSACCRFVVDKWYTFNNTSVAYGRQLVLYLAGCGSTMGIGVAVFKVCLNFGLLDIWSKSVSIPFVTIAGWMIFKYVVFR